MEETLKRALAKILSEVYVLQNQVAQLRNEDIPHSNTVIEELSCGYEHVIDMELGIEEVPFPLKKETYYDILETLDKLEQENPNLIRNLKGFYDLPSEMRDKYNRTEWLYALKTMKNEHRFNEIISRIEGSKDSPAEFKNFDFT